eukprot:gene33333-2646_t
MLPPAALGAAASAALAARGAGGALWGADAATLRWCGPAAEDGPADTLVVRGGP